MIDALKGVFGTPSAEELATREYETCRRELLSAERNRDYHTKMVEFYLTRLTNLSHKAREAKVHAL